MLFLGGAMAKGQTLPAAQRGIAALGDNTSISRVVLARGVARLGRRRDERRRHVDRVDAVAHAELASRGSALHIETFG